MPRFRTDVALAALAALLGGAAPAAAQVPAVTTVFPPGGQVGTKATVNVVGGNLNGATAILLSGEGVEAKITDAANAANLPVELTIAPNAVPGPREVRIVTPRGSSNAGRIWIGAYPEVNETEGNNTVAAPQKLEKLPVTVNGQVNGGEDVDCFTFQAAAGDTYVFDLVAFQMASALDGYLALYDGKGRILQSSLEAFDRDPRLIHTFKTAGTYTVAVRDTLYRGGGNFVYKLTAGKVPAITGYLPMGGKRGETVNVAIEGVNLGGMKSVPVQIPADRAEVTLSPATPGGPTVQPISLVADDLPEQTESEPNDAAAQAVAVAGVPVILNGRMDKAGDRDLYRIKPAAAGNLSVEVQGRRLGSRIDSVLRILDASGKQMAENDDAVGKDSRLVLNAAAGTEYLVEVRALDNRHGGEVFYRLRIEPPGPQDFTLTVTPDSVNVGQAGSAVVTVGINRLNGFAGPVTLRVDGLPAGVAPSQALIPAGAGSAQFTLSAEQGAAPGALGQIKVVGAATVDGKTIERVAQPIETYVPPLAQPDQARQRPTAFNTATVMPQQAYALSVDQKTVTVKRGASVQIKVTALRQEGQKAAINLTVAGQPANVNPAVNNIAEGQTEAVITLNVAANAPVVTQNLIISGNMANNVQPAPAITLTITE